MGDGVPGVPVKTGLEVLVEEGLPLLEGKRVGLVTNHTGVDARLRSGIELLRASRRWRLVALFGPEHGIRGEAQAGVHVGSTVDRRTGLPVHSLYGETRRPPLALLRGLDALVFDLQDVGVRYATYASTLALVQEAAAEVGVPVVVLDRPNPLNGVQVEGNLPSTEFASFVGIHPVPARHGLTIGELAWLSAAERGLPAPAVVPMRGWQRGQWFDETGLPWVQPSPNLPTLEALTLYTGTCLIEGTNVSEGRGTTRPFELLGAPWIDPFALVGDLEARGLPGVAFRPAYFTPVFSKHAGALCAGVQIHVTDRESLRPVELGLHLLHALRRLSGGEFAWLRGDGGHLVDRLLGSDRPRRALDAGASVARVIADWEEQAREFERRRRPYLLYE